MSGQTSFTSGAVVDFAEAVDDRVAALLVAGTAISIVYNDAAGTLTINGQPGVTDHGALTGLGDDDHPQYAKKAGDTFSGAIQVPNIHRGAAAANLQLGALSDLGGWGGVEVWQNGTKLTEWGGYNVSFFGRPILLRRSIANGAGTTGTIDPDTGSIIVGSWRINSGAHNARIDSVDSANVYCDTSAAQWLFRTAPSNYWIGLSSTVSEACVTSAARLNLCTGTGAIRARNSNNTAYADFEAGKVTVPFVDNATPPNACGVQIVGTGAGNYWVPLQVTYNGATMFAVTNGGTTFRSFYESSSQLIVRSTSSVNLFEGYGTLSRSGSNIQLYAGNDLLLDTASGYSVRSNSPYVFAPSTFATVPSASARTGATIRITDRSHRLATSDGTNWNWAGTTTPIS